MELSWWIIVMGTMAAMVASFLTYFCGCCKKTRRSKFTDESVDMSGILKITNPDSIQSNNGGPVAISITKTPSEDDMPIPTIPSNSASMKRLNGIGNNACNPGTATRSLPELPVDATIPVSSNRINEIPNNFYGITDTNSDLYATLEEHKIREHPYAHVDDNANANTLRLEQNSLERRSNIVIDEIDGIVNIPAASAIAGSVAASNELPYMTPPIHSDHFSGDSQDSAKGYTSITVREPLARIRPQKLNNQENSDSHYTVLSDDSDEMYAAIQDAYTSGSETYAQIQPIASSSTYCSVPGTTHDANVSQRFSIISVHSRQASTSSVVSMMVNRNSPKEKRQANSPLPKPPDVTPDDMYAKVLKKRKSDNDWCNSRDSIYHTDSPESVSSPSFHPGSSNIFDLLTKQDREFNKNDNVNDIDDPDKYTCGYETLPERNYELLSEVNQSPGYETVKENDSNPGYESLPEPDSLTPGYERIRQPISYEKLKYETKEDESDPNYEELKPQNNEHFHCYATIDKTNKIRSSGNISEPDYASLKRNGETKYDNWNSNDTFYEKIRKRISAGNNAEDKFNDKNNNHSAEFSKNELPRNHSVSETNLSDLYSKVHKTVKR